MGKFGDIEAAKAKADLNARIKAMLMLMFQMFSGGRQNTANMIHNFIPHLKRTDRDCGSLPFFSSMFTSHKTNKEHILLSMISKVVQTYWDMADDTKVVSNEVLGEFTATLMILEEISKDSLDNFGVYPVSRLHFSLMSKDNLDKREAEETKKEQREAEKAEEREAQARKDEAEGKQLMEAELGSGETQSADSDSPSTQSDADVEDGTEEAPLESSDGEKSPAMPSAPEVSSEKTAQPKLVEDQVSAEDADACNGNCDTCDNAACQTNQKEPVDETEELLEGQNAEPSRSEISEDVNAVVEVCKPDDDSDVADCAAGDVENIFSLLADEQGGKTDTVPPMPKEEKDYQAAVDHETGADQVDDADDTDENYPHGTLGLKETGDDQVDDSADDDDDEPYSFC